MLNSKTSSIFIIIFTILFSNAFSQEDINNSMKFSKALQFQIDENFTLKDFQGAIISFKKHLVNSRALRIGLSTDFQMNTSNSDVYHPEDTLSSARKIDGIDFSLGIFSQYLFYSKSNSGIQFFWGAGPTIGYSRKKSDIEGKIFNNICIDKAGYVEYHMQGGLSGVMGVKWLFRENMSLSAEYGMYFSYNYSKFKTTRNDEFKIENINKSLRLGSNPIKFGLSIYF
ncbi:MAG: hypothetical protein KAX28_09740 [Candidatus Marinimicrobia bacterium]|nr:hypothetical protein [Candidatus Neomarinimicrobiota bacterium]